MENKEKSTRKSKEDKFTQALNSLIELGKSKLLYIPLCGANFEWEEEDE